MLLKKSGILLAATLVVILAGCTKNNATTSKRRTTRRIISTTGRKTTEHDKTDPIIENKTIYVATNGLPSNIGTETSPTTIDHALTIMNTGDTIHLATGTYKRVASLSITNSGSEVKRNTIECENGVILDFSSATDNGGFNLTGSYWQINNLNIANSNSYGFTIKGKGNKLNNCSSCDNSYGGYSIDSSVTTLTNCISENNSLDGYDAYGFYITGSGENNKFDSCVSTKNQDSGFVILSNKAVTFDKCLAIDNGLTGDYASSQRSGFVFNNKGHSFNNCIAYNNELCGFLVPTAYAEKGSFTIKNCSAINNHTRNFYLKTNNNDSILIENILSYNGSNPTGPNDYIIGNVKNSIMVYQNGYYYEKSNTKYDSLDLTKTAINMSSYTNKFKINTEVPEEMKEYINMAAKEAIDKATPAGQKPDYSSLEYKVIYYKDGKLNIYDYLDRSISFQTELFNKLLITKPINFGAYVNE